MFLFVSWQLKKNLMTYGIQCGTHNFTDGLRNMEDISEYRIRCGLQATSFPQAGPDLAMY